MENKVEQLNNLLIGLVEKSKDIVGAMIVSVDGLVIASHIGIREIEPDIVAAMGAALLGLSKRIIGTLQCGELKAVSVEGSKSSFRVYSCGNKGVLVVIVKEGASVGLINLYARATVPKIIQVID